MKNIDWWSSLLIFFVLFVVAVILLVFFHCDAKGEELVSVSNADIFAGRCNPAVNTEGVLKAEVAVEFFHSTHANVVLVKTGIDSAEVYRSVAEPEPRKNLRMICGGWQLEQGVCYQLLLIYQTAGEGVHKLILAEKINWSPKNLVAKQ